MSFEQSRTKPSFEASNPTANRTMGEAKRVGRGGKGSTIRRGKKRAQAIKRGKIRRDVHLLHSYSPNGALCQCTVSGIMKG
jgi:hypothetical protein